MKSTEIYKREFYESRNKNTFHSAEKVLSLLFENNLLTNSAIDVGCGVGTWLSVLQKMGIKEIQGVDGPWVDLNLLEIPQNCFKQIDFNNSDILFSRKFDLAISLEVAEHLPTDHAKKFIESLTSLSDNVLFSAAIPHQGGVNHVNEQWQHYWIELFNSFNYEVFDFIRPKIWNDKQIPCHYRQNIFFFKKRTNENISFPAVSELPIDLVHPELYLTKINTRGVKSSFMLFLKSLISFIKRKV